jgi:hypothetical protein
MERIGNEPVTSGNPRRTVHSFPPFSRVADLPLIASVATAALDSASSSADEP